MESARGLPQVSEAPTLGGTGVLSPFEELWLHLPPEVRDWVGEAEQGRRREARKTKVWWDYAWAVACGPRWMVPPGPVGQALLVTCGLGYDPERLMTCRQALIGHISTTKLSAAANVLKLGEKNTRRVLTGRRWPSDEQCGRAREKCEPARSAVQVEWSQFHQLAAAPDESGRTAAVSTVLAEGVRQAASLPRESRGRFDWPAAALALDRAPGLSFASREGKKQLGGRDLQDVVFDHLAQLSNDGVVGVDREEVCRAVEDEVSRRGQVSRRQVASAIRALIHKGLIARQPAEASTAPRPECQLVITSTGRGRLA